MVKSKLKDINTYLRGEFVKNVLTLMTGTILGQVVVFLFAPIVTRLFSPDDLTTLELFTMIITVGVVIVTGKYEFAIMHPKEKEDARHVLGLSLGLATIMSSLLFIASFFLGDWVAAYYHNPTMGKYLWMVPIALLSYAVFNAVNYWFSRQKNYRVSAASKIWFSGASEPLKLLTGSMKTGGFGLLISTTVGNVVSAVYCLFHYLKNEPNGLKNWDWKKIKEQAYLHRDYPMFSIWGSILNRLAQWAHVGIFTYYFGIAAIGYMALCRRIFFAPLNVISTSYSQVFFQRISEIDQPKELEKLYYKSLLRFVLFSAVIVLIIQFLPSGIMGWVFGAAWEPTTDYLKYLSWWYALNFITSSLSFITLRIQMQRMALFLDALHFAFVYGGIFLAHMWNMDTMGGVKMLVASKVLYFTLNMGVILYFLRKYTLKQRPA